METMTHQLGYFGVTIVCIGAMLIAALVTLTCWYARLRKEQELELAEFLDNMSTMMAQVGLDGQILMVNRIGEVASGLPREQLYRTNFLEGPWWTFDPEVQQRVSQAFKRAVQGEKVQYDERLLFAGIETVHISFSLTPVRDGSGVIRYLLAEGRDITALKEAKEALSYAQKVARLANWEWNTITHKLTWSREFARMLGIEASEAGMDWETFSTSRPEEATFLLERMKKCIEKNEPFSCNRLLRLNNGVLRWLRWSGEAFFDATNKLLRLSGTIQDITPFKMAEEQRMQLLEEKQKRANAENDKQRSQFLAQAALLLSSTLDFKTTIRRLARLLTVQFSDWCALYLLEGDTELYRAFGIEQLSGEPAGETYEHRLYLEEAGGPIALSIRDEKPSLIANVTEETKASFIRDSKHGQIARSLGFASMMIVPLIVRGRALGTIEFVRGREADPYDENDLALAEDLSHYAAVAIDNARLYAEALRARERANTLAAIVESSDDAIIGKNLEGVITSWNKGAENMYGYSPSEVVGRSISILVPDNRKSEVDGILTKIKQGEPVQHLETVRLRKDGSVLDVSLVISPIRDESGKLIGASSIARDISAKKRYEEDMAKARDIALESARLKSEFVANVSHEIRTPMNAVIGMMSVLLGTPLTAKQRSYAETVRSSCDTLLAIINDILDFSKMEAGKVKLEVQDFDLSTILDNTIEFLSPRAHFKGIELMLKTSHDLPRFVMGDPSRITQVLMNLIGNAIKFTDAGEVIVRVNKKDETDGQVTMEVAVTDTGCGIPKDKQRALFQPFSQVLNSENQGRGGTGLGLALSKRFVESMGGEIGVRSDSDKGSTFWFRVKLEKQKAPDQAPVRPNLPDLRALVISESASVREVATHMMSPWKLAANESAENGEKAIQMLTEAAQQKKPYNVVLLDRRLGHEGGPQWARRIRSLSSFPSPRLVLMTTMDQPLGSSEGREFGIESCLIKPFRAESLMTAITGAPETLPEHVRTNTNSREKKPRERRPHILVVEDNSINQKVMLLQLEQLGCTADAVANGLEALDAWEHIPYDFILMDCQMPDMDGYTAAQTIRAREKPGSHIPIIAMTAHVMAGDREKCLRAGMDDYVPKPIKTENLEAVLAKWNPVRKNAEEKQGPDNPLADREFVSEISQLFNQDAPARFKRMKKAFKKKNLTTIKNEAHSIAGSCMIVGTQAIKNICRQIEDRAEKKRFEELAILLEKLDGELQVFDCSLHERGGTRHEGAHR